MKVAVTGGRGFIGTAVCAELQRRGISYSVIDRASNRDWPTGTDITNPMTWEQGLADHDAIIHLAGILGTAELFDRPYEAVHVNVLGTLNILEACEHYRLGYVGVSMLAVFPSVYTATKLCADRLASAYYHAYGLPVSKVRAFNAYGPGQKHGPGHPQKILPTFATAAYAGRPIPIWGDGEQTVDLVHVDDLARLLVDALGHGDDVTFDGGTGIPLTVNAVAEMVLAITGSKAGVEYLPMRRGEVPTQIVATGEGWDRLDWKPEFDPDRFATAVQSYRP